MPILSKEDARSILEKVMSFSTADECSANLSGYEGGNIRYARNTVSTSGAESNYSLSVTCAFGKKTGSASINEFDDASLKRTVARAEELAKLAPENPEYVSVLGPQEYKASKTFKARTAAMAPEDRTKVAEASIVPCAEKGLVAAGFMEDYNSFNSIMNSKGLFAYNRSTSVDFSVTVRTEDGTGSGYALRDYNDFSNLDAGKATNIAIRKAMGSKDAKAIEPGKYTVILEPAASVGLIRNMMWSFGARGADEGRSFLAKKGGGNRLGEQMFDPRVTIYTDPFDAKVPTSPWSGNGLARKKTTWIEKGVVKNMYYSRYWAEQKGVDPVPGPSNLIMVGGSASLADMIKSTKKGILVTRTWYIRSVDPQTLLYTGLTRDGTFYIEDGELKFPVKNFRFNESPVIMLNNIEELGKPQRINGRMIPPMKIRDFNFTSLSDAI